MQIGVLVLTVQYCLQYSNCFGFHCLTEPGTHELSFGLARELGQVLYKYTNMSAMCLVERAE